MTTTPGMIHTVYFWLKPGLSVADRSDFVRGAKQLGDAPTVLHCFVGVPADTAERDVTDHSFDYSLHLMFTDVAAQNAYQIDPVHLKFVEEQADKFATVKVLDTSLL
ncbi:MAG: Dabb family protein [Lewinella sp.]